MLRYLPDSFKIRRFTTRQLVAVAIALLVVLALYYNALPHYSDGRRWTPPPVAASRTPPAEWQRRADQVKQAFLHAYHGYETHAMLHDEIRPLSNQFKDKCVACSFRSYTVQRYPAVTYSLCQSTS